MNKVGNNLVFKYKGKQYKIPAEVENTANYVMLPDGSMINILWNVKLINPIEYVIAREDKQYNLEMTNEQYKERELARGAYILKQVLGIIEEETFAAKEYLGAELYHEVEDFIEKYGS